MLNSGLFPCPISSYIIQAEVRWKLGNQKDGEQNIYLTFKKYLFSRTNYQYFQNLMIVVIFSQFFFSTSLCWGFPKVGDDALLMLLLLGLIFRGAFSFFKRFSLVHVVKESKSLFDIRWENRPTSGISRLKLDRGNIRSDPEWANLEGKFDWASVGFDLDCRNVRLDLERRKVMM